jgi:hypothetical protein
LVSAGEGGGGRGSDLVSGKRDEGGAGIFLFLSAPPLYLEPKRRGRKGEGLGDEMLCRLRWVRWVRWLV